MIITTILLAFGFLGLPERAQAVVPPPDGGYPGGNTAEGQNALFSLTSGTFNTAVGFFSLRSATQGNFNTATGAGTLLANTADNNTATGAGALLSNATGFQTRPMERSPFLAIQKAALTRPLAIKLSLATPLALTTALLVRGR
jgi:hypothetical protein